MKRTDFLLFWLLSAMFMLSSCDVDFGDTDASQVPTIDEVEPYIPTMIRFETAEGENLLSNLVEIPQDASFYPIDLKDYSWLDIRCVRESDGSQMTFSSTYFNIPQGEDAIGLFGTGPVLGLSWIDFDLLAAQNVSLPCQQHYTLHIRSTRFWVGEEHTITWGIEFLNRKSYTVFSCAIDGKESAQYLASAMDGTIFNGMVHLRP